MKVAAALVMVLGSACASTHEAPQTEPQRARPSSDEAPTTPSSDATRPDPDASKWFEAVVEIDAEPKGKHFQGVWLRTDDGQRLVVDYRARPWWTPFAGRRVRASGEHWAPKEHEQSIAAPHFRVDEMELVDPAQEPLADLVALGPQQMLEGRFEDYTWPEGTKLGGETMLVFVAASGAQYWLAHVPEETPPRDVSVRVRGRTVEPSPFIARPGGAYLWIEEVEVVGR